MNQDYWDYSNVHIEINPHPSIIDLPDGYSMMIWHFQLREVLAPGLTLDKITRTIQEEINILFAHSYPDTPEMFEFEIEAIADNPKGIRVIVRTEGHGKPAELFYLKNILFSHVHKSIGEIELIEGKAVEAWREAGSGKSFLF